MSRMTSHVPASADQAVNVRPTRRRWLVLAAVVVLLAAGGAWAVVARNHSNRSSSGAPSTRGYKLAGAADGISFWLRVRPNNIAILTTGRLGSTCNGSAATSVDLVASQLLCDDTSPAGAVESTLVPISSRAATVAGVPLTLLPRTDADPAGLTMAVLVLQPGTDLPQGPVETS